MLKAEQIRMKIILLLATSLPLIFMAGCGADSNNSENDKFSGYMPKFATDPVKAMTKITIQNLSGASTQKSLHNIEDTPLSISSANQNNPGGAETQAIEFETVDCTKASDLWNASPQANNFSNSALDFIRNLQAQTVFYYCNIRQQVFNNSATINTVNTISTVTSEFTVNNNSYYVSWNMPSAILNASQNKEQQVNSQGILINLQPGIDNTKTRVDLAQTTNNNQFSKRIRSTLQDRLTSTTNIRSVTVNEIRSNSDVLLQQNIAGRIIFDNKLSVITAAIKPGVGAATFLKQCATSPTNKKDDYLRECPADWKETIYDTQWKITSDINVISEIKNKLNVATSSVDAGAKSISEEQRFYNDKDETSFFNQRDLPAALSVK